MPASDLVSGPMRPEELKKIAYNVFRLGHGYKTCAAVLDAPVYTVREWYAQYKLGLNKENPSDLKPKRKSYTINFRHQVMEDYAKTHPTISELARRHEISKRTARRWVQAFESESAENQS